MKRFDGRRPERWIHRPLRRNNRLRLVRVFLGVTLFASTVATPVGVAAAPEVVEAEDVGKTLPASVPSRGTTQVSNQKVSSADGFDCEGDLGGWLYQVIWKKNPDGNTFELKQYDVETEKYSEPSEASYNSKDVAGDSDGDGNPNGLSMDPEGRAYVTYARDEFNKVVDLLQLLPDGTTEFIVNLRNDPKRQRRKTTRSWRLRTTISTRVPTSRKTASLT